jgi:hypothetical protein
MEKCRQCCKKINPVEAMLGPVCGKCCRKNHQLVIKHGVSKVSGDIGVDEVQGKTPTQEGGDKM